MKWKYSLNKKRIYNLILIMFNKCLRIYFKWFRNLIKLAINMDTNVQLTIFKLLENVAY